MWYRISTHNFKKIKKRSALYFFAFRLIDNSFYRHLNLSDIQKRPGSKKEKRLMK
jgi:hypothetical protein